MNLSEFAFKTILIFIPGIISFLIVENITEHKRIDNFRIVFYTLILGFLNYLIYYLFLSIINIFLTIKTDFFLFSFFEDNKIIIDFQEILFATLIAIPLGFSISLFINKSWLHRFSSKLGVSKKIGAIDVFTHTMDMIKPDPGWVTIRDLKNDLMYIGWIYAYSSLENDIELFLRNVTIYVNSTGEEMFETPGLYIKKLKKNFLIEFNDISY